MQFIFRSWQWLILLTICSTARGQFEIPAPSLEIPTLEIPANGLPSTFEDPTASKFEIDPSIGDAVLASTSDFSITLRTELLSRFVDGQTVKSAAVATQILEANVRGVQTTMTTIHLQSIANPRMAQLNILAQGTVCSDTIGYTPQARVATKGNHTFDIVKPVYFDGNQFLTKPAYGSLQARQFLQAVNSIASGLPLLGQIGDRIAWSEVYRRMPKSDSIVVRRVADDVLPEVNCSVDKELFRLNQTLSDVRSQINSIFGSVQIAWTASSMANSFSANAVNKSVSRRTDFSGMVLTQQLAEQEAATILISQDGINHLLAKQPLGGLVVSDTTLQKVFLAVQEAGSDPAKLLDVVRRPADLAAEPLIFSLKFADTEPLQIFLEDSLLNIALKFQVQPKAAPASQTHLMKIAVGGQSDDSGMWSVALKNITVVPASINEQPDSWTQLINAQAGQMVSRVPSRDLPRVIDLRQVNDKLPVLRIYRIQSKNGQLRISFKADAEQNDTLNTQ